VTIDILPDDALLTIFNFYVKEAEWIQEWHKLVQVCQKWRNIVFASPRRLRLRLYCRARTPVRETLGVWPQLPIVIWHDDCPILGVDNIIAALEHNKRVCEIRLGSGPIPDLQQEEVLAAMQAPFPALTDLRLRSRVETAPVVPDSFMGGYVPHLQTLILDSIPFPGLPRLLLSATYLVHLSLWNIPHSGYIPPETMVTCLSELARLNSLFIGFESPQSRPDWKSRRPPPPTRTPLPVLTDLRFKGASEYLEDFMARIDAPQLYKLKITFFHQLIFDTPELTQFINRTSSCKAHREARVVFSDSGVRVTIPQAYDGVLELAISCSQPDWQLSSLAQVCNSSFPQTLIRAVKYLEIHQVGPLSSPRLCWQDDIECSQWIELLHPFTAVKDFYISHEFAPRLAPVLQGILEEGVREVLPALQTLYKEEQLLMPIGTASGDHWGVCCRTIDCRDPIAISRWKESIMCRHGWDLVQG
jgi:hypothetical protein